jgi:hypothetical protein
MSVHVRRDRNPLYSTGSDTQMPVVHQRRSLPSSQRDGRRRVSTPSRPVVRAEEELLNADAQLSEETPVIHQRRSLPSRQRDGMPSRVVTRSRPVRADVTDDEQVLPDTDALVFEEDAPLTNPRATRVRNNQVARYRQPLRRTPIIMGVAIIVIAVWGLVWSFLAVADWCIDLSNTYHYGPTRTTVVSGVFGHHDSPSNPTEVVAVNLNGTVLIEEVPGADVSKARVYPTSLSIIGEKAAKIPVLLTVKDVNGDGKLDVQIVIPGQQGTTLELINKGNDFSLAK